MANLVFETLIDDGLSGVTSIAALKTVLNKKVLSFVNDYEDGKWMYRKFQQYIWNNIALTALSAKERAALVDKSQTSLVNAAKNLRLTDKDLVGKGSEIAEIFLYGVMKDHFEALPVVPKIFYKQNSQDNVKGADSVHLVIENDDFSLWFGEAKFYNSVEDARLESIVKSVFETLGTDKIKKENSIITNVSDINELVIDAKLKDKIIKSLNNLHSIDSIKSKIHIPIMIIHQCSITSSHIDMTDEYRETISKFHVDRAEAYFTKQLAKSSTIHKYGEVTFHIILFPVPDKSKIVDAFIKGVEFYKGE